jgi:hydroxymethylbilane synthase
VEAERAMNLALHGSCHVPVAAYARLTDGRLVLSGLVGSAHSGRLVRASSVAMETQAHDLGLDVAEKLLAQGAGPLQAGSGEPDTGPFVS